MSEYFTPMERAARSADGAPAIPPPPPSPAAVAAAPAKPAKRPAPKWESDARDQIRSALRKFAKPLADLIDRDANEGDTRLLVTDMLTIGLGFDKYEDLTTEYQVKGEFADYGVRIDKQLVAFIEVKRCTTKLSGKHLRQVQSYAANEGVEWMILTNGVVWQVYHLTGGLPLITDLALEVDLLDDSTPSSKVASLFYICRDSLKRRQIDELWEQKRATSPKSIASALVGDRMVDALRKEIRRTTGYNPDGDELARVMRSDVLRDGLLEVPRR